MVASRLGAGLSNGYFDLIFPEGRGVAKMAEDFENCEEFGVYVGRPAKKLKTRNRNLLIVAQKFIEAENGAD